MDFQDNSAQFFPQLVLRVEIFLDAFSKRGKYSGERLGFCDNHQEIELNQGHFEVCKLRGMVLAFKSLPYFYPKSVGWVSIRQSY